jgi:hypothetical protein
MHKASTPSKFKRTALALFAPAFDALTGYMAVAGLMRFADEPGAVAPLMAGDAKPAEGAPGADAKPADAAGDKPADGAQPGAAGEAKPAEGAAAEAKPAEGEKKPEDKPAAKAPEKYEFKAPEGFEVSEALAAEFTPVLKDLDLTQEQADKLMAFAPKLIEPAVDNAVSKTLESIGYSGCKDWAGTAKADPEFGGDKLSENLAVIKTARDQFASPELRKLLETTVLGNHPEMLRLFYRIGKQITPDGYVPNGKATGTTNTAKRLYDNSQMNP